MLCRGPQTFCPGFPFPDGAALLFSSKLQPCYVQCTLGFFSAAAAVHNIRMWLLNIWLHREIKQVNAALWVNCVVGWESFNKNSGEEAKVEQKTISYCATAGCWNDKKKSIYVPWLRSKQLHRGFIVRTNWYLGTKLRLQNEALCL